MKKGFLFLSIAGTLIVAVFLLAFKSSVPEKMPVTLVTYYYGCGVCYQRISPNIQESDCRLSSLEEETFKTTSSWSTASSGGSYSNSDYIASITFNEGTGTSAITLQQALNCLWDYYAAYDNLPVDGAYITCNGVQITVRRKTAVC